MQRMRDSLSRKGDLQTQRRWCQVGILFWALASVESVFHYANICAFNIRPQFVSQEHPYSILSLRGGDRPNHDDDDEERTRFWSLGALFRLNADAKGDASLSDSEDDDRSKPLHLQRGNGRGGALAVHSAKSKRAIDQATISRAWAVADEAQSDDDDDDDDDGGFEQTWPLETMEESESEEKEAEQIEPLEPVSVKGESNEEDGHYMDESDGGVEDFEETETEEEEVETSLPDQFTDATPVSTASSRLIKDEDADIVAEAEQTEAGEAVVIKEESDGEESLEVEESEGEAEEPQVTENEEETPSSDRIMDAEESLEGKESAGEAEELKVTEIEEGTPSSDRFMDATPVFTASSRLLDDEDTDIETESDEELKKEADTETNTFEMRKIEETVDAAEEIKSDSRESMFSKLWWTRVRTETEDVPDLEQVPFDESDAEISISVVDDEKEYDEQDDTFGNVKSNVAEKAKDILLQREDGATVGRDEIATMRPLEKEAPMVEIPEVETDSIDEGLQASLEAESTKAMTPDTVDDVESKEEEESPYTSSGYWGTIDRAVSFGLSDVNPDWKLSRHLRTMRKSTARVTGLHGFLSRKGHELDTLPENAFIPSTDDGMATINDEDLGLIRRRIAAIQFARQKVASRDLEKTEAEVKNRRGIWRRGRNNRRNAEVVAPSSSNDEDEIASVFLTIERKSLEEQLDYERRKERVKEIDGLILKGQRELLDLQCEKDALQRRPNPLYNYTTTTDDSSLGSDGKATQRVSRTFNFPPQELVDEYIDELFANRRLEKMNHTDLWKNGAGFDDDEDESIGDDLLTPSADARKLYEPRRSDRSPRGSESRSNGNGGGGGGSWLLRQNIGKGASLGEKIGEATETAAYKAICASVMQVLARIIAAIHGVNIMTHSDIRLYMDQSPDLPPVGKNVIPGSDSVNNYAQEAIMDAMRKGVRRHKKRGSRSRRQRAEEPFLQRDAVVETLISHCQISAPLLKLFPLAWQRALLGNIISLIAAIVSDFCDGIQLQILGHQLSFAFKPITESDMIRHIGMAGNGFNHRRARPEQFEAAIRATAEDVSDNLQFLDRWHHRALGSGMLRAQIANLIARIVLTLADEVLSSARMDLWSAQAGGPRMLAGLEYRTTPGSMDEVL